MNSLDCKNMVLEIQPKPQLLAWTQPAGILFYSLSETGRFFLLHSVDEESQRFPVRLTRLEMFCLTIQYLQTNLSEANGLLCLSLALLYTANKQ